MNINERRIDLGLTFAELAERSGLSLRTAYRLARNNMLPGSLCAQRQLARALRISFPALIEMTKGKA